jgi:hypothetical protein
MVKRPRMYRQGDVLVLAVDVIPRRAKPVDRDRGLVVLAYGEATGHAHAIADRGAALLRHRDRQYLRVTAVGGVTLTHEEHDTLVVPPGDYRERAGSGLALQHCSALKCWGGGDVFESSEASADC